MRRVLQWRKTAVKPHTSGAYLSHIPSTNPPEHIVFAGCGHRHPRRSFSAALFPGRFWTSDTSAQPHELLRQHQYSHERACVSPPPRGSQNHTPYISPSNAAAVLFFVLCAGSVLALLRVLAQTLAHNGNTLGKEHPETSLRTARRYNGTLA